MSNNVHLIGTEEVMRAANRISAAAEQMSSAASSIDHSLEMFLRRYEDLVVRMEHAATKVHEGE